MAINNKNESRNFTANSTINDTTVMYMSASYNTANKDLSFNKSIRNTDLYRANKAEVDKDYEDWSDEVYTTIFGED